MKKNKCICFFIGNLSNKGGTEKMTTSLANELVKSGYSVSIISLAPAKEVFFNVDERIRIYSVLQSDGNFILKYPQILYRLSTIAKEQSIDILINVDIILSLFSLPLKIFDKTLNIISWEHFNYKTNLGIKRRDYARELSKKYADAIVTLTEQDRNFYLENRKPQASMHTISNFIEELPDKEALLEATKVIAVGRFSYQKGFDILAEVWSIVKKNKDSDGWILQIIGDGDLKDDIKDKIKKLHIDYSVEIIDAKENISDYYLDSSIYVMTSRFEGLPMVLIESKSYGLPIIAFDCLTGPQDLVEDTVDGYLVEMGDLESMADKINMLMKDSNLRKSMGQKAKLNSLKFEKKNILKKWETLFDSLF